MHETEFYQKILGLQSPWVVSDVKLDTEAGQVDIHVEHGKSTKFCCPECGIELACYDHVATSMLGQGDGVISTRAIPDDPSRSATSREVSRARGKASRIAVGSEE